MNPPDVVLDKAVKEIGNSIYGKLAQGVAGTRIIKDDIEQRHVFNTLFGVTDKIGPSAITNAMMASYCTGLVRALLLETIGTVALRGRGSGRQPPTASYPHASLKILIRAGRWRWRSRRRASGSHPVTTRSGR